MVNENRLKQLQQQLAQKQTWLENELSQRPRSPQLGDIFIFIHSGDELGLQWVILDNKDSQFFIVPADDTPMVGSMDIDLPDSALCSPLTLRCDLGVWVEATDFDLDLRIGVLEEWHRRRALERVKQISEKPFKIQFQKNMIQFLKFWHSGLPKMLYRLVGDIASVGSVLYQEMNYEPAYLDFKQQLNNERRALTRTLSTTKKSTKPIPKNRFDWTWGLGLAIAAVLVLAVSLTVFWPKENPIDTTYQTIYAQKTDEMAEELDDFKFRWEKPPANIMAFSPEGRSPSPATKAFGAGLFTARESLLGKHEIRLSPPLLPPPSVPSWVTTEWNSHFQLGRWLFLLWTACQFPDEMPKTFWAQQSAILAQFIADFQAQTTDDAMDVMDKLDKQQIEQLLNQLPTLGTPESYDSYYDLGDRLKKVMSFLAPPPMEKQQ